MLSSTLKQSTSLSTQLPSLSERPEVCLRHCRKQWTSLSTQLPSMSTKFASHRILKTRNICFRYKIFCTQSNLFLDVWPNDVRSKGIWPNIIKVQTIWPNVIKVMGIWPNIIKVHGIRPNVIKVQVIRPTIIKIQDIWPNVIKVQVILDRWQWQNLWPKQIF